MKEKKEENGIKVDYKAIAIDAAVDHPTHYNTNNPAIYAKCECGGIIEYIIECIDVIRDMPSWKGNAIKYLWRAGLKGDAELTKLDKEIQDLEKAIWYINDRIKYLKKAREASL